MWEGEAVLKGWHRENWAGAFKDGFLEARAGNTEEGGKGL